jgi:hypothetical protein
MWLFKKLVIASLCRRYKAQSKRNDVGTRLKKKDAHETKLSNPLYAVVYPREPSNLTYNRGAIFDVVISTGVNTVNVVEKSGPQNVLGIRLQETMRYTQPSYRAQSRYLF